MTRDEAMTIVNILNAAFPHGKLKQDSIKLYVNSLLDLPADAARAAALNLIAEGGRRFIPTIGEIRAATLDVMEPLPTAEEAWGEVRAEIHHEGYYGTPQFSHPAIEKAVRAVGWRDICSSDQPGVVRAHFLRVYDAFRERHQVERLRLPQARAIMGRLDEEGRRWLEQGEDEE